MSFLKIPRAMTSDEFKELELFNAHQEDSRKRAEFMAKSVFLIGGTALTLSINLFLGKDAPKIQPQHLQMLQIAWAVLFCSIVGYIAVLSTMLIRDYSFGERWRKNLSGADLDTSGAPGWCDALMWVFGVGSVLSLVAGLGLLAWVSSSLLTINVR